MMEDWVTLLGWVPSKEKQKNNKCGQGSEESRILMHCWWEDKPEQSL